MLRQYFYEKYGKRTWLVRVETYLCVSSLSVLLGRLLRRLIILLEKVK